jgi:D-threo-aldose 1-dehydrogenase
MMTNRLGRSSVEVSQLGFGGGPLGGLFTPLDDDTAARALAAAWDCGIRYFDTSPHYGIGHSERRIGESLRDRPRADFTLSTKVGRVLLPQEPEGRMDEAFMVPVTHRRVWAAGRPRRPAARVRRAGRLRPGGLDLQLRTAGHATARRERLLRL